MDIPEKIQIVEEVKEQKLPVKNIIEETKVAVRQQVPKDFDFTPYINKTGTIPGNAYQYSIQYCESLEIILSNSEVGDKY